MTPGYYAPNAFSQKLLLADDLMPKVRSREKCVTVRAGNRNIKIGALTLESTNGTEGACVVVVTEVSVSPLRLIPAWALEGGKRTDQAVAELQQSLRRYYPELTLMSEVTAIEFAYVGEAGIPGNGTIAIPDGADYVLPANGDYELPSNAQVAVHGTRFK